MKPLDDMRQNALARDETGPFTHTGEVNSTILVVDDNPVNLRVLCTLLDQNGYRSRPAINGEMALKDIARVSPDLILLDITMPGLNGFEVCERIKQDSAISHIPVMFISAADDMEDVIRGFDVGGVDYITKPFESRIVLARVKSQLALYSTKNQLLEANKALKDIQHNLENTVLARTHDLRLSHSELEKALSENERLYFTLKQVAEGLSGASGEHFFVMLTQLMIQALDIDGVHIFLVSGDEKKLQLMCCEYSTDKNLIGERQAEPLDGDACEKVIDQANVDVDEKQLEFAHCILDAETPLLEGAVSSKSVQSYAGVPIHNVSGGIVGVIQICRSKLIERPKEFTWLLELFSLRAASELQRREVETALRDSALDLERQVLERTDALRLVNKELESFSYSVSHDLRAPLRTIQGFSQALMEDYTDKLDEQGRLILNYLIEGSQDMSDLIDGLLSLSRSSMGTIKRDRVDLTNLASSVVNNLRMSKSAEQPAVIVQEGMNANCDAQLMSNVYMNLIGNAWKYSAKVASPAIEVGSFQDSGGVPIFFVKDNGAGFDMSYKERLFKPFMRLHRDTEFRGTGIGLATVQRIINRHGGDVWAESTVGEGAAFFFKLGSADFAT